MNTHSDAAAGLYSVHPAVQYAHAVAENMAAKTGRSLEEWSEVLGASGLEVDAERRTWLMDKHSVPRTDALMIVDYAAGRRVSMDSKAYLEAAPGFIEAMYEGHLEALRPLHDRIVEIALSLGDDVRVCPRSKSVPLYRKHMFAEIKPSVHIRLDLGLALRDAARLASHRLVATPGAGAASRITHRFELRSARDIDDEVVDWLEMSYRIDI